MISIDTAIKLGEYKITGGAEFQWKCFGPNARYIDFEGDINSHSYSIVMDIKTQVVYQADVCDYKTNNCYRIIHPDYVDAYIDEAESRNVNPKEAWDDVEFIDLNVDEDFIEKATAILNGLPYDERVIISFDLPNNILFELMKQAHEQDITLNEYIEQILINELNKYNLP